MQPPQHEDCLCHIIYSAMQLDFSEGDDGKGFVVQQGHMA